ncbi:hypothetical protein O9993_20485 [Vibrio lentus]|nr:hypothetical protein [Vibrio lentus]
MNVQGQRVFNLILALLHFNSSNDLLL